MVRMANGVLITETAHGFVCANGGVDASNVGPGSGSIVTLLPRDPDASAAAIRAAVRERFGVDVPVIVSDSLRAPVALGHRRRRDRRVRPAPARRPARPARRRRPVMRSTVRAVADELASAAELALGKTAGDPSRSSAAPPSPAGRRGRIRGRPVHAGRSTTCFRLKLRNA